MRVQHTGSTHASKHTNIAHASTRTNNTDASTHTNNTHASTAPAHNKKSRHECGDNLAGIAPVAHDRHDRASQLPVDSVARNIWECKVWRRTTDPTIAETARDGANHAMLGPPLAL